MTIGLISFLLALGLSLLLDAGVQPRRGAWRSAPGMILHALAMTTLFGLCLGVSGSAPVAGGLTVAVMALFVIVSNAKHAMLGEPLLFSDLALVAGIVRHPGFYLTALSMPQRGGLVAGMITLLIGLAWFFVPYPMPHLIGIGLTLAATTGLVTLAGSAGWATLMRKPDVDADLTRHGLIATMFIYWMRWCETRNPPRIDHAGNTSQVTGQAAPDLVIVVQCESFADPVEVTGNHDLILPGLTRARSSASQWGNLHVSGFGAYTMRTEFGVLFGRSEEALGFRRYDPFLTAHGEASYALSARLGAAGHRCLFVHPHDLRFYGRDRLMPAIGFDRMLGEEDFPPPPSISRHVDDRTVGTVLCRLIDQATTPTFVYAVTMENHGPWAADRLVGSPGGLDAYLHHLRNGDAMLNDLIDHLIATGRSALLVFFGDHRPSIPGATEPGEARHTPYVMVRFRDGAMIADPSDRVDLTPDRLHHAILRAACPGYDG